MMMMEGFWRRLFYYLIGFFIGCVLVYVMLFKGRDRQPWLPENRIKWTIGHTPLIISPDTRHAVDSLHLTNGQLKNILSKGDVVFGKSQPHAKPYPVYFIRCSQDHYTLESLVSVSYDDSVSTLLQIHVIPHH